MYAIRSYYGTCRAGKRDSGTRDRNRFPRCGTRPLPLFSAVRTGKSAFRTACGYRGCRTCSGSGIREHAARRKSAPQTFGTANRDHRITSYNVCYTKLLRVQIPVQTRRPVKLRIPVPRRVPPRITSYNVCYTKLLRACAASPRAHPLPAGKGSREPATPCAGGEGPGRRRRPARPRAVVFLSYNFV